MVERIAITPDMTTQELHDRMAVLGADLMVRALGALERGTLGFSPQAEAGVTYAAKIDKAEARIDWSRPRGEVHNTPCAACRPSPAPGSRLISARAASA